MRFTITYDGPLVTRGSAAAKEQIRQRVHPQMKELWTRPEIANMEARFLGRDTTLGDVSVVKEVGGHVYAPLVSSKLHLLAELDILLLRPERPGGIVTSGGDIDNRLKTLLDALCAPTKRQEVSENARPSSLDDPTYTLLEDDNLITKLSVETDQLLAAESPDSVRVVIAVRVWARYMINATMGLI